MTRALALALSALTILVACGNGGGEGPQPVPITAEELAQLQRQAAMEFLQQSVAGEMRHYVADGRFTEDVSELDLSPTIEFVEGENDAADPSVVRVTVCEGGEVVVLANAALSGDVFAVKARGLAPPEEGEAVFSHYAGEVPPCDPSDGPEAWPGGFFVSRQGLQGSGEG